MVAYIISRSYLIPESRADSHEASKFRVDAPTAPISKNLMLIWISVNNQRSCMATVTQEYSDSGSCYAIYELWDLRPNSGTNDGYPFWIKRSSIVPFSKASDEGLLRPSFDPTGQFVCFNVAERTLEINPTQRSPDSRPPSRIVTVPWRITAFALSYMRPWANR